MRGQLALPRARRHLANARVARAAACAAGALAAVAWRIGMHIPMRAPMRTPMRTPRYSRTFSFYARGYILYGIAQSGPTKVLYLATVLQVYTYTILMRILPIKNRPAALGAGGLLTAGCCCAPAGGPGSPATIRVSSQRTLQQRAHAVALCLRPRSDCLSMRPLLSAVLLLPLALPLGQGSAAARDDGYCPKSPQCAPGNEECGPLYGPSTAQFHVRDTSCSNGDPNGMFWDEVHSLYHVFYQTFKGPPCNPPVPPCGGGTEVWGHVVSKDMATWEHLPAAIWTDHPYDSSGAWTGSTTLVNGAANPVIMFPGLVAHGTFMNLARPANRSDPRLVEWASETTNLSATTDYSSAWQTASGDYLTVGHEGQLYRGSHTFSNWTAIPGPALWPSGDCPDVFELPRICEGCGSAAEMDSAELPTHVFKHSLQNGIGDVYQFGRYTAPAPTNTTSGGIWVPLSGFISADIARDVHNGTLMYASKSFNDTKYGRRVWFGGVSIGNSGRSCLTLPREVTYNPTHRVLQFNPVAEISGTAHDFHMYASSTVRAALHKSYSGVLLLSSFACSTARRQAGRCSASAAIAVVLLRRPQHMAQQRANDGSDRDF